LSKHPSAALLLFALALACCACGHDTAPATKPATENPSTQSIPEEYQAAARSALGADAEVLLSGDLALTGLPQVVAINRLQAGPGAAETGVAVTRVSILSRENGRWKEAFRCDEHLKNPQGYLQGTPAASVSGWRLVTEQLPDAGLALRFSPWNAPSGSRQEEIVEVRWNRKAGRYQAMDRARRGFLGETVALETPVSRLKR
jgi:hypothetical protein